MKLFEFYKIWNKIDGKNFYVMDLITKRKYSSIVFPVDYWNKEVVEFRREYTDLVLIVK